MSISNADICTKALEISLLKIEIYALKRYLNLKLEICVFWINTNISIKIITDIFIQLKIYF